jgi:3D (Asp-Asp-Asp) domain-containing protein
VRAPSRRLLGLAAAGAAAVSLPANPGATPPPTVAGLKAEQQSLELRRRAAVLELYALDSRVAATNSRLHTLRVRAARLRAGRAMLERELTLAHVEQRREERRLAARIRALYDRGDTTTLDLVLGAASLRDATTQLDDLDRIASLDDALVAALRTTRHRAGLARAKLAARSAALGRTIGSAESAARALAAERDSRAGYVASLAAQEELDASRLAQVEAEARAAVVRSRRVAARVVAAARAAEPAQVPAAAVAHAAAPAAPVAPGSQGSLTVMATAYCGGVGTASGLPLGPGVVAVDPSVIPFGTRMSVPGYGEGIAADRGTAIVGARIDVWFPTCAQARGWGAQSVTIALH